MTSTTQIPSRLFFSFPRIWTIAGNTMTEIIRQKFFYILVLFSAVVLLSSSYLSQFSTLDIDRVKFVKDFSLAGIKLFGIVIAIVGTSQLLPLELENRTIYPILAKPVFRGEFLLGKFLGIIVLLFLTILFMSTVFAVVLGITERQVVAAALAGEGVTPGLDPGQFASQISSQTRDPALIKALLLIFHQMVMISSITLLIATFATSVIFNVISAIIIYICGHLEGLARESWLGDPSIIKKTLLLLVTFLIPDLGSLDVVDHVVIGRPVAWAYVGKTIGYAVFYSSLALAAAYCIFQEKEI
jgi:hypothetical protein